ncbi:MAG: SHOCT domain-containing protein [Thermoleophilaceae bacterium]|nr:SHOCT domain-containing protein [Thermoleophilaceae bacterium]
MGKRRAEAQEYEARGEQAPEAPAETGGGLSPEVLDRLKQLGSLKDQGILTEQEFAEQKAKLLAG